MLHEEALEADGTKVILAKGLYVLQGMDLASTVLELTDLIVTHLLPLSFILAIQIIIIIIISKINIKCQHQTSRTGRV